MMPLKIKTLVIESDDCGLDEIAVMIEHRIEQETSQFPGEIEDIQVIAVDEMNYGTHRVKRGFIAVIKYRERML